MRRLAEFCQTLNGTQGAASEELATHTQAHIEAGGTGATLAYNILAEDKEGRGTEKELTRRQAYTAARRAWENQQYHLLSNKEAPNFSERWMLTQELDEVFYKKYGKKTTRKSRASSPRRSPSISRFK